MMLSMCAYFMNGKTTLAFPKVGIFLALWNNTKTTCVGCTMILMWWLSLPSGTILTLHTLRSIGPRFVYSYPLLLLQVLILSVTRRTASVVISTPVISTAVVIHL